LADCVRRVETEPLLLCSAVGKYPPQLEHVKNASPARQSTYARTQSSSSPFPRVVFFHREARGQQTMPANISPAGDISSVMHHPAQPSAIACPGAGEDEHGRQVSLRAVPSTCCYRPTMPENILAATTALPCL